MKAYKVEVNIEFKTAKEANGLVDAFKETEIDDATGVVSKKVRITLETSDGVRVLTEDELSLEVKKEDAIEKAKTKKA